MRVDLRFLLPFLVAIFANLYAHLARGHNARPESQRASAPKHIDFIENLGQWSSEVRFKADIPGGSMFITDKGFAFSLLDQKTLSNAHACAAPDGHDELHGMTSRANLQDIRGHAYRVNFLDAQLAPDYATVDKRTYYHNYFLGNDPQKWKGEVPLFGKIIQKNIYKGIDAIMYSEGNSVKYDFVVRQGSTPKFIKLEFEGLNKIALEKGHLVLTTSIGNVMESAPYAYQLINGKKSEVACHYSLNGNIVTYVFPNGYNSAYDLIIDPEIIFASLSGATITNWGYTATYDEQGHLYAGGIGATAGYPVTVGAFQPAPGGGVWDITLSKYTPTGNDLVYSTYLGGSGEDHPHSLVVDASGNLIVAGKSMSTNYPTTTSAYATANGGGYDIVVTKFNAAGSGLIGSTYIGGNGQDGVNITTGAAFNQTTLRYNYGDDYRGEVITDDAGNIYVACNTQSSNFPVTPNAAKSTIGGMQDGVFFKFDPNLSSLIYSTYIGGSNADAAYVLTLDKQQNYVYVAGGTVSTDFHTSVVASGWQGTNGGGVADGYICRFQNSGAYTLTNATFIGTSGYDQCYGVQVDGSNNVYAMGQTTGNFPISPGVYSNANSPQFVIKLEPELNSVLFSTVFGNGSRTYPNISPVAFMVDACQNIFISGWGGNLSTGSTTTGLPVTPDAIQSTTDGGDLYFFVLSRNAAELLFASFFGASGGTVDHVDGGTSRFDPQGVIYQAICSCNGPTGFPTTPGAYVTTQPAAAYCNIGVVKIDFQLTPVKVEEGLSGGGADADEAHCVRGCKSAFLNYTIIPDDTATVINYTLSGNATNGTDYAYLNGSIVIPAGQTSAELEIKPLLVQAVSTPNPKHVIITTLSTCGDAIPISVDTIWIYDSLYVAINTPLDTVCPGTEITITAQTDPGLNFVWTPEHLLPNAQTLTVTPTVTGTTTFGITVTQPGAPNTCPPRTATYVAQVEPYPLISIPNRDITICPKDSLNLVINAAPSDVNFTYKWTPPNYLRNDYDRVNKFFAPVGVYKKVITVSSPVANCTSVDSLTITVVPPFTFDWVSPKDTTIFYGDEVQLDSESEAIAWVWSPITYLSDAMAKNPMARPLKSMVYTVTGMNEYGCIDTALVRINVTYRQRIFVPNAFTPNGDGRNDVFKLENVIFERMLSFKIFNRWGNLVFDGVKIDDGWDGTIKGKPAPVDTYFYDIQLVGENGEPIQFKGNLTLMR